MQTNFSIRSFQHPKFWAIFHIPIPDSTLTLLKMKRKVEVSRKQKHILGISVKSRNILALVTVSFPSFSCWDSFVATFPLCILVYQPLNLNLHTIFHYFSAHDPKLWRGVHIINSITAKMALLPVATITSLVLNSWSTVREGCSGH